MYSSHHQYPDIQTLTENILTTLSDYYSLNEQITILAREPNTFASTFPSEIVTCQLADGSKLQLLCKYEAGQNHNSYGHRGGVTYEAEVYQHVLEQVPIPTPTYYGDHKDVITGETWLFLEHFTKSLRLKFSSDLAVMRAAARWLGTFHRTNESLLSSAPLTFLNRHDVDYYLGWAKRTSLFAGHLHQQYPWLEMLCKQFEKTIVILMEPPLVIVHGEYYPKNILFFEHMICPVDWESAAVAIGEIDLASLTEKWPSDFVSAAKAEYQKARWPEGTTADFEHKFDAAKLYWHFRWLGDRPEWTTKEKDLWRFEEIRLLGERLGLI